MKYIGKRCYSHRGAHLHAERRRREISRAAPVSDFIACLVSRAEIYDKPGASQPRTAFPGLAKISVAGISPREAVQPGKRKATTHCYSRDRSVLISHNTRAACDGETTMQRWIRAQKNIRNSKLHFVRTIARVNNIYSVLIKKDK